MTDIDLYNVLGEMCKTCYGVCCKRAYHLLVNEDDLEKFHDEDGKELYDTIEPVNVPYNISQKRWYVIGFKDGQCPLYDEPENKCTVHGNHPAICRTYPVKPIFREYGTGKGGRVWWVADGSCPAVSKIRDGDKWKEYLRNETADPDVREALCVYDYLVERGQTETLLPDEVFLGMLFSGIVENPDQK